MRGMLADVLDLLLPRACARCGGAVHGADVFCARCVAAIPRIAAGGCPLCQIAITATQPRCAACAHERLPLGQVAAEAPFAGEIARWVHAFKYPSEGLAGLDPRPGAALAALVADAARRLTGEPPVLVAPVPMHPHKRRERGFHPAGELARTVASALGARVERRALQQVRVTASQTGLERPARRRNVRGAFEASAVLRGVECVALVDDVVTTGATLFECARALRRAGVRSVVAVCAARTL
jgi:predicted amidophosphoribosyltransferase